MSASNNGSPPPPHNPGDVNCTDGNEANGGASSFYVSGPDDNSTVASGYTDPAEMPTLQLASRVPPLSGPAPPAATTAATGTQDDHVLAFPPADTSHPPTPLYPTDNVSSQGQQHHQDPPAVPHLG